MFLCRYLYILCRLLYIICDFSKFSIFVASCAPPRSKKPGFKNFFGAPASYELPDPRCSKLYVASRGKHTTLISTPSARERA